MQIKDLPASTTLATTDAIPKETSGGVTQKITGSNLASQVKSLGNLVNTTEMNNAIAQSTADVIRTGDVVNSLTSTATDKPLSANMGHELDARLDRFSKDTGIIWRLDATDINTIIQTGNYYANNNCPNAISGGGYLTVLKYDDSYVLQTMFPYNSPNMYVRVLNNNVWSNWKSMM